MERSGAPAVAEIKSVVEPDRVADFLGRESMALIGIHRQIIDYGQLI